MLLTITLSGEEKTLRNYLNEVLLIEFTEDTSDAWVNENLKRAQDNVNWILNGKIGTKEKFDALAEYQQRHVFNAIGRLANYWIENRIFSEGESVSSSVGSLSYSQTNSRAPDFVPKEVRQELELSDLYNYQSIISSRDCTDKTLVIDSSDDPYAITYGENKMITHKQTSNLIDQKISEAGISARDTGNLPTVNSSLEGGATQKAHNESLVKKTQHIDEDGHVMRTPSVDYDIANKKYVDDIEKGVSSTPHLTASTPQTEGGNTQQEINISDQERLAQLEAKTSDLTDQGETTNKNASSSNNKIANVRFVKSLVNQQKERITQLEQREPEQGEQGIQGERESRN